MATDQRRPPALGPESTFRFPAADSHILSNGVAVRTVVHRVMPVVTFVVQIDGGSSADPPGKSGLASLVGDVVGYTVRAVGAATARDELARLGATTDIVVGSDTTTFTVTTLARHAARAGALLGELLAESLREDAFTTVKRMRLAQLSQANRFGPMVSERAMLSALYGDHPYARLPIGIEATVRALSFDDLVTLRRDAFTPSATHVVIAGALSDRDLLKLAADSFSHLAEPPGKPRASAHAADTSPLTPSEPGLSIVPSAARQADVVVSTLVAPRSSREFHAVSVMNAILGGEFTSRLNMRLREERGQSYRVRTSLHWRRGTSPLVLRASVHGNALVDAMTTTLAELEGIGGSRPVTEDELELARLSLTRGFPRKFETAHQVAWAVSQAMLYRLPDDDPNEFIDGVLGVTANEVCRVGQRYFDRSKLVTVLLCDPAMVGSLQQLGAGVPRLLQEVP